MKFKTLILLGASTLAVGATSLAIVSKLPEKNSGVGADSTVTLYVQVGSYWNTGSYAIWHWASGSGTWSSLMTSVTGVTGLYSTSIPSTDTNVIFTEFNSGTTTPDWGSKKYQTGNLTYGSNNLYTLTSTTAGTWSTYTPPVTYDVTEYEVVDGVLNSTAIATEKASDGIAFTPTSIAKSGYVFDGWYTDSSCTSEYSARVWTAAGNLYAQYSTLAAYDVYFAVSGWSQCDVYTFGGNTHFGSWPGAQASATNGVNFMGLGGLYKITIPTACTDTSIVFNNGSGGSKGSTQTFDLKLAQKTRFYWVNEEAGGTGDRDKAYAAKVVFDINAARLAVTASTGILAKSYCGVSAATANTLLSEYNSLNDTAKAYMAYHNLTDYTYNYSNTGASVDVEFSAILARLRIIAGVSGSAYYVDNLNASNILVYSILGAVGALSVGGFFFFQKKRREEIR